jgi:hypothetical protein
MTAITVILTVSQTIYNGLFVLITKKTLQKCDTPTYFHLYVLTMTTTCPVVGMATCYRLNGPGFQLR